MPNATRSSSTTASSWPWQPGKCPRYGAPLPGLFQRDTVRLCTGDWPGPSAQSGSCRRKAGAPDGTLVANQLAVTTPFGEREGCADLELVLPPTGEAAAPSGLRFVLLQPEENRWLKSGGQDLYCPLFREPLDPRLTSSSQQALVQQIVAAEKGASSWTLMHRYQPVSRPAGRCAGRGRGRWPCCTSGCVTVPCASSTGSGATTPSRAS